MKRECQSFESDRKLAYSGEIVVVSTFNVCLVGLMNIGKKKTILDDFKELLIMFPVALFSEDEQGADFPHFIQNIHSL